MQNETDLNTFIAEELAKIPPPIVTTRPNGTVATITRFDGFPRHRSRDRSRLEVIAVFKVRNWKARP